MLADCDRDGSFSYPLVGGLSRVIIVYGAAGRVPAVNCVLRSLFCGGIGCNAPVAVIDTAESAGLINNSADCVGEGGVLDTVQNNSTSARMKSSCSE
jgi:hypothetical protein